MIIKRIRHDDEKVPFGYGIIGRSPSAYAWDVAIWPLNRVIRAYRQYRSKWQPSWLDSQIAKSQIQIRDEGYQSGYQAKAEDFKKLEDKISDLRLAIERKYG